MSGRGPVGYDPPPGAAYRERTVPSGVPPLPTGRTGDGHDAAAHPAREHSARPPVASAPHPARRLRPGAGEPRLPVRGRARAEGGFLGAARFDLRRPRGRARRPARRGQRLPPQRLRDPARRPPARAVVGRGDGSGADRGRVRGERRARAGARRCRASRTRRPASRWGGLAGRLTRPLSSGPPAHVPGAHTRAGNAMNRTRRGLLDGAARAFATSGVRRATMQSIAAAAGVAKATLYNHFRTKDEVARELLATELDRLTALAAALPLPDALAALSDECAGHPVLRRIAETEPELLAGLLTTGQWPELIRRLAAALEVADEAAELAGRWLLGVALQP